jgi:diaminopimelate epimerase
MHFTKMEGLGNDYIIFDCTKELKIDNPNELSKKLSNRHFGIGSDGIILIKNSNIADYMMDIYNKDGSRAEMCGNGIRCIGKYIYDKKLTTKNIITIETLAGIKELKLNIKNNKVDTITIDMGEPILNPISVPFIPQEKNSQNISLIIKNKQFQLTCLSVGNPHAVTIIKNLKDFDVKAYGELIEKNNHFPNKTNVEFIEIQDKKNINMRVWERGSGETLACGTGASAVLVACVLNNLTDNLVNIHLQGGTLTIEWNKQNNHIYMEGPANIVYEGII